MIKHICVMRAKTYGGSYGVGDTQEAAKKKARGELGEKPAETRFHEVDVPKGRKLVVQTMPTGIQWWTEPEEETE